MATLSPPLSDLMPKLVALFAELVPVPNFPGSEHALLDQVRAWLDTRGISYTGDYAWGLSFSVTPPTVARADKPGVLLLAHMDSDNLDLDAGGAVSALAYDPLRSAFTWEAGRRVGLDCKTGVVMALAIADQVRQGTLGIKMPVHFLLTVGEEVGQRGLLSIPEPQLRAIAGSACIAVALDRQTKHGALCDVSGRPIGEPRRHVVHEYCGVKTVPAMIAKRVATRLARAASSAGLPPLPAAVSRNCSDILELKVRTDCELRLPQALSSGAGLTPALREQLTELKAVYEARTAEVRAAFAAATDRSARVLSFQKPPRSERYAAAREVAAILEKLPSLSDEMALLNLSYDYDEPSAGEPGQCRIAELAETSRLVLGLLQAHSQLKWAD
mmetsp:Transcript_28336/g.92533  ORF Transcript_28336/g.92533 Transcript_28336/m.92533 type:complete len:386 (+) Transcript_28336:66-1223(+)